MFQAESLPDQYTPMHQAIDLLAMAQVFPPDTRTEVIGGSTLEGLLSGMFDDAHGAIGQSWNPAIGAYDIIGQENGGNGAAMAPQAAQKLQEIAEKLHELRQIDPNAVAVAQRKLTTRRRQPIGFTPAIDVQAGDPFELRAEIQEVFRTERLIIPSEVAPFIIVNDAKVGTASQFANSAPIPAAAFSEVSTFTNVDWRTANLGNDIVLTCTNIGPDPIDVYACAIGTTALGN